MALFDNGFKGNILTGLGIGLGATILAPVVVPVVSAIIKPLAKAAIKGGVLFYEKGRETVGEVGEVVEDLVAEVKSEIVEAQRQAAASTEPDVE